MLMPKVNGEVRLCLDLARLNKGLIKLIHRSLTLNCTLSRLAGMKYLTLIDAGLGYHNLN